MLDIDGRHLVLRRQLLGRVQRRPQAGVSRAARRQAARIFSIVSASLTSLPVNGAGPGRSTYSGRGTELGTARRGETAAGTIAVEDMGPSLET